MDAFVQQTKGLQQFMMTADSFFTSPIKLQLRPSKQKHRLSKCPTIAKVNSQNDEIESAQNNILFTENDAIIEKLQKQASEIYNLRKSMNFNNKLKNESLTTLIKKFRGCHTERTCSPTKEAKVNVMKPYNNKALCVYLKTKHIRQAKSTSVECTAIGNKSYSPKKRAPYNNKKIALLMGKLVGYNYRAKSELKPLKLK